MTVLSTDANSQSHHRAGILPPWLWFWLLLYLSFLPKTLGSIWQSSLQPILFSEPLPAGMGGKAIATLQALPGIIESLPIAMLLVGVLMVLFPKVRQRQLERTYNLELATFASPVLQEIIATVAVYSPDIEIKTNLLRTDQFAFAYPMGYRKSAIAIFGGLVKLWRSDPDAGRAILLHELGHCRHGDVLMIGAGSFFETLLNSWVRFLILFFIIPTIFLYGWFLLGSLHEHWQLAQMLTATDRELNAINSQLGELGIEPTEIPSRGNWFVNWLIFQVGMLFTLGLPSTVSSVLALILTTPIVISLPLMATWCAEFNADQFVVGEQMTQAPLLRSLAVISSPMTRWAWLTSRLSHPPTRLRQWLAPRGLTPLPLLALLVLFPLAYGVRLMFMNIRAIVTMAVMFSPRELWQTLTEANAIGLRAVAPILLGAGVVLLLYPRGAARWERLFCKASSTSNPPSYKEYAWAAGIVGGLGVLAYGLSSLMAT